MRVFGGPLGHPLLKTLFIIVRLSALTIMIIAFLILLTVPTYNNNSNHNYNSSTLMMMIPAFLILLAVFTIATVPILIVYGTETVVLKYVPIALQLIIVSLLFDMTYRFRRNLSVC